MDDKQLEQIEARAEKTTPGPWERHITDNGIWSKDAYGEVARVGNSFNRLANSDFIAASRTDIPTLCAALREAWADTAAFRAEVSRLKSELATQRDENDRTAGERDACAVNLCGACREVARLKDTATDCDYCDATGCRFEREAALAAQEGGMQHEQT